MAEIHIHCIANVSPIHQKIDKKYLNAAHDIDLYKAHSTLSFIYSPPDLAKTILRVSTKEA